MNSKEYQKLYQNIKKKSPIESGVQTLVYMFLYEIMKDTEYQLIVIDRMGKKTQFVTYSGVSDLAIVSDEFSFSEEHKDDIISYVEVKGIDINLCDFEEQIKGQLLSVGRIICTNGSVWKYYDVEKYIEQHSVNAIDYVLGKNLLDEIKIINDSLELVERELAIKKSSYAHTQKKEYRLIYESDINKLEENKTRIYENLKEKLMSVPWMQDVMAAPIIDIELYDNDIFDVIKYMKLKSELYDAISLW